MQNLEEHVNMLARQQQILDLLTSLNQRMDTIENALATLIEAQSMLCASKMQDYNHENYHRRLPSR